MGFAGARERLIDSVFQRLGEPALWGEDAVQCRIRWSERDTIEDYDRFNAISRTQSLRVHKSEIAAPKAGDQVRIVDDEGVETGVVLTVSGVARLSRNLVWIMPITVIGA